MGAPDAPAAAAAAVPSRGLGGFATSNDGRLPPSERLPPPLPSSSSSSASASPASVERTYASLIQSYLSVLCHDNATFLAERMVAHSPRSARARFLLAMCHYRAGRPNRARSVLRGFGGAGRGRFDGDVHGEDADGCNGCEEEDDEEWEEEEDVPSAIAYLLARCCLDLGRHGEAEDALLRPARERYQREFAPTAHLDGGAAGGWAAAGGGGGGGGPREMDRWVLTTSPCPVPNGAAGLNLLGTVCRRTNRRGRAAEYYRMSLKLDPLMWSSYEALCEMGAATTEEDDPTKVFGVVPSALRRLDSSRAAGSTDGGGDAPPAGAAAPSPAFSFSGTPLGAELEEPRAAGGGGGHGGGAVAAGGGRGAAARQHQHPHQHQHQHRSFATPTSPDDVEDPSYAFLGGDAACRGDRGASVGSGLHATSLFHTGGRGGGGGGERAAAPPAANGPSASLFDTPGLTPIRRRGDRQPLPPHPGTAQRGAAAHPLSAGGGGASSRSLSGGGGRRRPPEDEPSSSARVADSAAARVAAGRPSEPGGDAGGPSPSPAAAPRDSFASPPDGAVSRARRVAARLYYGPSPETTPPPTVARAPPASSLKLSRARHRRRRRLGGLTSAAAGGATGGTPGSFGGAPDGGAVDASADVAAEHSRLSFSSSSAGPGVGASAMATTAADLSTPFGEKRALFRQSSGRGAAGGHASGAGFSTTNTPAMRGLTLGVPPSPAGVPPADAPAERSGGVGGGGAAEAPEGGRGGRGGGGAHADASAAIDDDDDDEEGTYEEGGVRVILELLCTLGAAQRMLCQYRCQDALQIFHRLPHPHFDTGWVQHQVGRAHFEMADYHSAQRALEAMHRAEPHRMRGLEVLSTALWHLKKEVELSHLAQTAVDFDRTAPESWCVVGNCFSLQKEHETALAFFRRSVRLDPSFTYSHTLSGHEYVANEDFDKAVQCYRDALRSDERHYNAWYGLGAIYYRQEKYDLAEYHFRRALDVNPQSSVLRCHLGMALHAGGKPYDALDALAGAFRLDPRNPQARYQRATIWMSVDRPAEALAELERVRDAAPREASVHFAMGRVLKRLGKPERAMRCFLTALDLDPKDNNLIKAAMDRLDEPDVDEDVSAF